METNAYHQHRIMCDGCAQEIFGQIGQEPMPISHNSPITVDLHDWRNSMHPMQKKTHHFCNEACLSAHLAVRQQERENHAHASLDQAQLKIEGSNAYWQVNLLQSDGRDISYKERHNPKEYFLDEKNKSFPVMNCTDVSAVMHRIGTYKGPMSVDAIRSKLKKRAAELGCTNALPEADKDKKTK